MHTRIFNAIVAVWLMLTITAATLYSLVYLSIQPDSLSAAVSSGVPMGRSH
jgi:hypothetical protein